MNRLQEKSIQCPYCGETIDILIDGSEARQDYIEDCQVCCCPIAITVNINEQDDICVTIKHQNE